MNHYSGSMLTTSTTATQYGTMATIKGSTTQPTNIKRIEIFTKQDNAVAGGVGLAWSTALTTATITNGGSFQPHSPEGTLVSAGTALIVSTTGTMATNGGAATVFRRFVHPGAGGAGIIWGESELGPLIMALGSTAARGELCIVNLFAATPALYHVNVVVSE